VGMLLAAYFLHGGHALLSTIFYSVGMGVGTAGGGLLTGLITSAVIKLYQKYMHPSKPNPEAQIDHNLPKEQYTLAKGIAAYSKLLRPEIGLDEFTAKQFANLLIYLATEPAFNEPKYKNDAEYKNDPEYKLAMNNFIRITKEDGYKHLARSFHTMTPEQAVAVFTKIRDTFGDKASQDAYIAVGSIRTEEQGDSIDSIKALLKIVEIKDEGIKK